MVSDIGICNLALNRIGVSRTINSFDERSQEADLCRDLYPNTRDTVLTSFNWSFAKRQKVLALLPTTFAFWDFAYRYPKDCLKVINVIGHVRYETPTDSIKYEIISDEDGRIILTNRRQAAINYIARVTDTSLFDPLFTEALAWKLASELGLPTSARVELANNASQQYSLAIESARVKDLNEQNEDLEWVPQAISARLS